MVFERGEVLIQYFRRALIDILQQVQNGIDKDCISFWLENLIDLFLRSAHLYQDGGQVLAVLCVALTTVENCRQSEDDPSYGGIIVRNAIAVNSVLDLLQYINQGTPKVPNKHLTRWARWNVSLEYHFDLLTVCTKWYCLSSRPGS